MSGSEENTPTHNMDGHRPLKHVQSAAGRLQCSQNGSDKNKSTSSLVQQAAVSDLKVSSVEFRRRSRSAPLTLEATKIAQELTRLSDLLNVQYTVKNRAISRVRRHTFGTSNEHERRSFHFDYSNYEELRTDLNMISEETPDFQRGTSV